MTAEQVISELRSLGSEPVKKILLRHGVREPLYGVKVEDLKKLKKKIKKDHALSLALYDSGIADAQYLAALIADEQRMTPKDLRHWARHSCGAMVAEYAVPWITAESAHGYELAQEWIASGNEQLQTTGWFTLSSLVAIRPDEALDIKKIKALLLQVRQDIASAGNRVRYAMNTFVISAGSFVKELTPLAVETGHAIGKVTVDMNGTACKVPYAPDYIQKVIDHGSWGKKKKMARC